MYHLYHVRRGRFKKKKIANYFMNITYVFKLHYRMAKASASAQHYL